MTFDTAFVIKVFAALFAIMNPVSNVSVFLSLTAGFSPWDQRQVAVTATIGTSVGCVIVVLAGGMILKIFDMSVEDFRLAGGLLVLLIALTMVQGEASSAHSRTDKEKAEEPAPSSVAIYPLTLPLLLGPGTIATLILFGDTARTEHKIPELAIGLCAFLALLAATMLSAPWVGRHLSQTATAITRRVMGMILAAIAMEMIVSSLRALFPGLAGR